MNFKKLVHCFAAITVVFLILVAVTVIYVDPFFHYNKPRPELFYTLKSQRYQNDGILKNFDYDAIITGTSMTENFKATEFDKLFGVNSIKVSYSGGSFKEINDAIRTGCESSNNVRYVIRSLDLYKIIADKNEMRNDLGTYPTYLYNNNVFDDGKYILNKEAFFKYVLPVIKNWVKGKEGGITSFDTYSNWNKRYKFGREYVLKGKEDYIPNIEQKDFSEQDFLLATDNINVNVIELAKNYPETTFYYFFPPYSIVYWANQSSRGELNRSLEAEKLAIEMILECPNIKLFSFNLMTDIVANLDNYKDTTHYGEWINSDILRYMKNDIGLLTKENYKEYLKKERELYLNYPYESI